MSRNCTGGVERRVGAASEIRAAELVTASTHLGSEESLASTHKRCWKSKSLSGRGRKLEAGARVGVVQWCFKSEFGSVEEGGKAEWVSVIRMGFIWRQEGSSPDWASPRARVTQRLQKEFSGPALPILALV